MGKLKKAAQVGVGIFRPGVDEETVIIAAQNNYIYNHGDDKCEKPFGCKCRSLRQRHIESGCEECNGKHKLKTTMKLDKELTKISTGFRI